MSDRIIRIWGVEWVFFGRGKEPWGDQAGRREQAGTSGSNAIPSNMTTGLVYRGGHARDSAREEGLQCWGCVSSVSAVKVHVTVGRRLKERAERKVSIGDGLAPQGFGESAGHALSKMRQSCEESRSVMRLGMDPGRTEF